MRCNPGMARSLHWAHLIKSSCEHHGISSQTHLMATPNAGIHDFVISAHGIIFILLFSTAVPIFLRTGNDTLSPINVAAFSQAYGCGEEHMDTITARRDVPGSCHESLYLICTSNGTAEEHRAYRRYPLLPANAVVGFQQQQPNPRPTPNAKYQPLAGAEPP